jgi:hypothetical protein
MCLNDDWWAIFRARAARAKDSYVAVCILGVSQLVFVCYVDDVL